MGPDRHEIAVLRRRLERLAHWLDDRFPIPGTNQRVGLDALLGLVPVAGDVAAGAIGTYLVYQAWRCGMPPGRLARMLGNLGLDLALGAIPLAGDAFDLLFKANRRNLCILTEHLDRIAPK